MAISKIENASLASGVPQRSQLPAGTVLQVVQTIPSPVIVGVANTAFNATLTTANTTSIFTGSITPTSSSSKILVMVVAPVDASTNNYTEFVCAFRGTTFLAANEYYRRNSGTELFTHTITYLDSPATTSTLTYDVRACGNTAVSLSFNRDNSGTATNGFAYGVSLTLMEIAA